MVGQLVSLRIGHDLKTKLLCHPSFLKILWSSYTSLCWEAVKIPMDMCSLFILEILRTTIFFFFHQLKGDNFLFLTSLIPWQSVPKPFLACFCGPALVPLRCDRWYSSSVAVESCLHHSLSIKSGNRQHQGYAARKYQPQASSEDLLHMLFPFLSIFFPVFKALSLYVLLHSS